MPPRSSNVTYMATAHPASTHLITHSSPYQTFLRVAALPKGLSEFAVISDLLALVTILDPGPDVQVGTNDDTTRTLRNIDLIYESDRVDLEPNSPDDALDLSLISPTVNSAIGACIGWIKFSGGPTKNIPSTFIPLVDARCAVRLC